MISPLSFLASSAALQNASYSSVVGSDTPGPFQRFQPFLMIHRVFTTMESSKHVILGKLVFKIPVVSR